MRPMRLFCGAGAGVGGVRAGRCMRAVVGDRKGRRRVSSASSQVLREHTQQSDDGKRARARAQTQTSVEDAGSSSSTTTTAPTGSAKLFADAFREETGSGSITADTSGDGSTSSPTGSDKLFADALLEESPSSSSPQTSNRTAQLLAQYTQQQQEHPNWTGEESMQDAVLRMLVDKYKPLRGPVIRSAEEKLRERPPSLRPASSSSSSTSEDEREREGWSTRERRAMEPLLPSKEGHRPWHTTFTPPSTLTPRVKLGSYASSSSSSGQGKRDSEKGARQDIAAARRSATAQRLGRARESMIDYKLGLSPSSSFSQSQTQIQHPRRPRAPPAGLKAWAGLVEERIERARLEGQFRSLSGRGRPIRRESGGEANPFIAREEFLMNRIVQRNQAAPPWVELQGEVESAISTFRAILRQAWTKRAVLALTSDPSRAPPSSSSSSSSSSSLLSLTPSDARRLRDPAWAAREASYHASALGEVNELVRRYNGVAPYSVRKPYFEREKELERCYAESAGDVVEGVRERVRKGALGRGEVRGVGFGDEERGGGGGGGGGRDERRMGIWKVVRTWIARLQA